ncbi:MAG: ribosome maturation factor RimP [Alphaproteobacteria bacterium]|nr:ribosome maturation factor RimP [Alphaproteobacteria bacterium]
MLPSELVHTVRELIEPAVQRLGFDLVAVEWVGDTRGPILRVSIDNPHGVAAKDCAQVSRYIEPLLDESDPIESAYKLEVSSPGIDRPVQRLADFARFEGYRVKIRLEEGHPRRRYTGRLAGVDGDEIKVEVDGVEHVIRHDTIQRAQLVLDLDEYQKIAEVLHDDE